MESALFWWKLTASVQASFMYHEKNRFQANLQGLQCKVQGRSRLQGQPPFNSYVSSTRPLVELGKIVQTLFFIASR